MTFAGLRRSFFLLACLGNGLLTGCATLDASLDDLLGATPDLPAADVPPPPGVESFVVEIRAGDSDVERYKLPLPEDVTYMQQVLDKSNALKRFGRVTMQLWRQRPDGDGFHKIDIPYDRKQRAIPPGYDYAIRPGDRLVILKDKSTVLDDMLESVVAPASALLR